MTTQRPDNYQGFDTFIRQRTIETPEHEIPLPN